MSSGSAEIIDALKHDPSVETDRLMEATVVDEAEEHVDFFSKVTLTVTERAERVTFPRSEYSRLCRQRVPYGECYDHAPGDFSEATVESLIPPHAAKRVVGGQLVGGIKQRSDLRLGLVVEGGVEISQQLKFV